MTRVTQLLVALGVLVGSGMNVKGYALEVPEAVSNHQKLAAEYEQKAKAEDEIIDEHRNMKKEYRDRLYINDKMTPSSKFEPMNKHCDKIIKKAAKLRDEYRDFSNWHRMSAEELQGK